MNSSYVHINKIECGSTMDGFGNTCFFNSLMKCLETEGKNYSYSYRGLLEFGAWDFDTMKGKMVDTLDLVHINTLAVSLNVRIAIYTEIRYNVVNVDSVIVLGHSGPVCRIVKVMGVAHFNMMTFKNFNPANVENAALGVALNLEQAIKKGKEAEDSKAAKVKAEMAAAIADADRRMKAAEAEKKILELTVKVSQLENEIIEWGHTLTSLGSDKNVEHHIQDLCKRFRDAMDSRNSFFRR
jgi:hypothetical protein